MKEFKKLHMKKNRFQRILSLMLILGVLAGCQAKTTDLQKDTTKEETVTTEDNETDIVTPVKSSFANWKEDELKFVPAVAAYKVDLPKDYRTGNVMISEGVYLDEKMIEMINKNAFVVNPNYSSSEFFTIYEGNRYDQLANFVSTDSLLHSYHLFFNYLLEDLENTKLYDKADSLNKKMLEVSLKDYETLKGTSYENAALINIAYFAVANKLFNPNAEIPTLVKDTVEAELKLIEAADGITESNIFGNEKAKYLEDYSQYIARSHYTKTEKLTRYFKGVMWYGRMTFRLKNDDETKASLLQISALNLNEGAYSDWEAIYEPINFFVGDADDLTYLEYGALAGKIFGEKFTAKDLLNQEDKLAEFKDKAKKLRTPAINSMAIIDSKITGLDKTEETMGYRFLGQRATIDATIFQKLIYDRVLEDSNGNNRMLPMGLDVLAAMGSSHAYALLEDLKQFDYNGYKANLDELKTNISKYTNEEWTKNLYFGWMNTLKALIAGDYGEGYPSFMTNKAWKYKEMMTFLASWTELKHDTLLYAKQVYAEMGGGPEDQEFDDRGYVEPNPYLYNRMKSLVRYTIDGLDQRKLLSDANRANLEKLEEMSKTLRDISIKELENKTLTKEEYEFIRTYGGSLEHFWTETLSETDRDKAQDELLNGHPASIVADVATDPNCCVLEEAVGAISKIYVVFPIEGKLHLGTGGVFSHYEFSWPMEDRLTDEKWRKLLYPYEDMDYDPKAEQKFVPTIAAWQKEFSVEESQY